jgi:hypothetical protein
MIRIIKKKLKECLILDECRLVRAGYEKVISDLQQQHVRKLAEMQIEVDLTNARARQCQDFAEAEESVTNMLLDQLQELREEKEVIEIVASELQREHNENLTLMKLLVIQLGGNVEIDCEADLDRSGLLIWATDDGRQMITVFKEAGAAIVEGYEEESQDALRASG